MGSTRLRRVPLFFLVFFAAAGIGLLALRIFSPQPISWNAFAPPRSNEVDAFSFLSANVGNANIFCTSYKWKLCFQDVENRIGENIKRLSPDLVFLQEVLAPWQCQNGDKNPSMVCHYPQTVHQARRLLGDSYTILCAAKYQYDCIGVKKGAGEILGCENGAFCLTGNGQETAPVEGCDDGFDVMAASILLKNDVVFNGINIHLQSTSAGCRAKMLENVFEKSNMITQDNILVAGDFNLDPFRENDQGVQTFLRIFGKGWDNRPFQFHSGTAEKTPAPSTYMLLFNRTLDLAYSNFLEGVTYVLGVSPATPRLDGGNGMDHGALYGILNGE